MTALRQDVQEYLRMRRDLGFKLRDAGKGLLDFARFMEQHRASYITPALALAWARQPLHAQPAYWARRLSFVRGFAQYRSATDPRTQIPAQGLLPFRPKRARPNFLPSGKESGHGLFTWDRNSGEISQILEDAIDGLTISADGTLAAFWDYSAGNKLTVYDLKAKHVVRTWSGQTHSEDDLVLTDLAFTPDGKSLLARLYAPGDNAVMQYEIASGKITPFAKDVQSMVSVGDSVYLLQFEPVPFTMPEHPHRLTKWTAGTPEPITLAEDFHYFGLSGQHGSAWLVAGRGRGLGYNPGIALLDTKTGHIQTAGESCDTAIVTAGGKILYVFGNEFVADPAVCNGPPPLRAASEE